MSGFFGFFNRSGRPAEQGIADTMLEAASYWDPDERGLQKNGPAAVGHAMLWNTPESKHEHLPLQRNGLMLTMDARIDNRDELAGQLELPDRPTEQIGDSEFILAAYRKWGEKCPKHLLGDFAFAIWDAEKEKLFCARDHMGVKPFYYYMIDDLFVFSNDLRVLLKFPGIPKTCNDDAVAIYLDKGELWHPVMTFYKAIKKLPPATALSLSGASSDFRTYWRLEEIRRTENKTFAEYKSTLQALLKDAVNVRLRTSYPVASHLSGGLDSSAVSVLAARSLAAKQKTLKAYSWVAAPGEKDDPRYFEWANSHQIAQAEKIDFEHIDLDEGTLTEIFTRHDISLNDTTDLWYEFILRKSASKHNIRTVLSGWGGDEFITYHGRAFYADLFRQGNIAAVLKGIWQECAKAKSRKRCVIRRCYRELFLPLLPKRLLCFMPKVHCDSSDYLLCARNDLAQKIRKHRALTTYKYQKSIDSDQLCLHRQGHLLCRLESWRASAFESRLEYSFPLLDKRIVEFALSLPATMYYHNGITRYLYRHAVTGILPENIQWGDF
ncbi:MAG: asparagine synthase-related protein, partial [Campylobacterales bacterium]